MDDKPVAAGLPALLRPPGAPTLAVAEPPPPAVRPLPDPLRATDPVELPRIAASLVLDGLANGSSSGAQLHRQYLRHVARAHRRYLTFGSRLARIIAALGREEPTWQHSQISLETMPWLTDHRPSYTVAVMPMMGILERMAWEVHRLSPGVHIVSVHDMRVRRWLLAEPPTRTRVLLERGPGCTWARLEAWRDATSAVLSRFEVVASARFVLATAPLEAPAPWPRPERLEVVELPYASGAVFHGPRFQLLRALREGERCAIARSTVSGETPVGLLNPGLLDSALHVVPHDRLEDWFDVPSGLVGYPSRLRQLRLFGSTPRQGEAWILAHAGDHTGREERLVNYCIQIGVANRVWAELDMSAVMVPKPAYATVAPSRRADVIAGLYYLGSARMGEMGPAGYRLEHAVVAAANWLPGSVEQVFSAHVPRSALTAVVAAKEAVAQRALLHPRHVRVDLSSGTARSDRLPYSDYRIRLEPDSRAVTVTQLHETLDTSNSRWLEESRGIRGLGG